jgi:hypothetical protein
MARELLNVYPSKVITGPPLPMGILFQNFFILEMLHIGGYVIILFNILAVAEMVDPFAVFKINLTHHLYP